MLIELIVIQPVDHRGLLLLELLVLLFVGEHGPDEILGVDFVAGLEELAAFVFED
jgi:hypothetical protein